MLGKNGRCVLDTGVPVLGGASADTLLAVGQPCASLGVISLYQSDDWLVGGVGVPAADNLEATTSSLYEELLEAARGWHLARIWNYVPAINAPGLGGLENYRAFSRGRSFAFEQYFGEQFAQHVPAASAVGTSSELLTVAFMAARSPVTLIENPLQVPAYRYPPEYGPRPPSFARSAVVRGARGAAVFISGTAAVRGHETMAPMDTISQLDCTLENLNEIGIASGLDPNLTALPDVAADETMRVFRVYVRDPQEFDLIRRTLAARLLRPGDSVSYVHSDICREHLTVEIEATIDGRNPLSALSSR